MTGFRRLVATGEKILMLADAADTELVACRCRSTMR